MDNKRIKKREGDRLSQQRKRQRDRQTVEQLEEQLRFLQHGKDNSFLNYLLEDQRLSRAAELRHKKRLLQMKGIIEADLADVSRTLDHGTSPAATNTRHRTCTNSDVEDTRGKPRVADQAVPELSVVPSPVSNLCAASFSAQPLAALGTKNEAGRGLWKHIEQTIETARSISLSSDSDDGQPKLDIHLIISAILRGWDEGLLASPADRRWSCLRDLDENHFAINYSSTERLAVMAIASQAMKTDLSRFSIEKGSGILPLFIKPRPSQLAFNHSPIADTYVWPGFRERLSICHEYYNDHFLNDTYTMFKFIWPHDFHTAYTIDPQTCLYTLAPQFLAHLKDLRCWTMNSDFVRKYPDFVGDIPISNPWPSKALTPVLPSASVGGTAGQWHSELRGALEQQNEGEEAVDEAFGQRDFTMFQDSSFLSSALDSLGSWHWDEASFLT